MIIGLVVVLLLPLDFDFRPSVGQAVLFIEYSHLKKYYCTCMEANTYRRDLELSLNGDYMGNHS